MKLEDIKKLHQKKFREEYGYFLLEGEHLVQELQKAAAYDARLRASEIYLTREYEHWQSSLPVHHMGRASSPDQFPAHDAAQRDPLTSRHCGDRTVTGCAPSAARRARGVSA
jgi:hypothetical protein